MLLSTIITGLAATAAYACDNCYGPSNPELHTRHVKRMQPSALGAVSQPRGPLAWGQLNFIHTTDTHGWLEGHLKEHNYGADWGDFVSFTKDMKKKATSYGVDLLLVDTGDLHDGAGLSDATSPNGKISNIIFENIDYDVLTIGNHELYLTDIAYETFSQFSKKYGDRYLTSNVQILNNATGKFEYIGHKYRYFTTPLGLRIMAFGVIYDFDGNTNYTNVITVANLTREQWFVNAVKTTEPVDLFLLIGHNPVRDTGSKTFTMATVQKFIRKHRPTTPIQVFGGHSHIRDLAVYDERSVGLESGRYCETMGWLSMSGIHSSNYTGKHNPIGVPNPTQKAINVTADANITDNSPLTYFRRYLDWNRLTFEYHAVGSQAKTFDQKPGPAISADITADRKALNLSMLYGCAPQTYCVDCAPFGSNGSIYGLLEVALAAEVIAPARKTIPRLIIINTGSIRFDLVQGPFTYDDSFIVSPFADTFQYLAAVPYAAASKVLASLNKDAAISKKKRASDSEDLEYDAGFAGADGCVDTPYMLAEAESRIQPRGAASQFMTRHKRATLTPGYVTHDDFGR